MVSESQRTSEPTIARVSNVATQHRLVKRGCASGACHLHRDYSLPLVETCRPDCQTCSPQQASSVMVPEEPLLLARDALASSLRHISAFSYISGTGGSLVPSTVHDTERPSKLHAFRWLKSDSVYAHIVIDRTDFFHVQAVAVCQHGVRTMVQRLFHCPAANAEAMSTVSPEWARRRYPLESGTLSLSSNQQQNLTTNSYTSTRSARVPWLSGSLADRKCSCSAAAYPWRAARSTRAARTILSQDWLALIDGRVDSDQFQHCDPH